MKISVFFAVLSFVFIFNQVGFANESPVNGNSQAVELKKQISELMRQKKQAVAEKDKLTKQYVEISKELRSVRESLRKGRFINDIYNKDGVDKETADLIDRCMAAEQKYAALREELSNKINESPAGIARQREYDESLEKMKKLKKEKESVIRERAEILQEIKKISKELKAAQEALDKN